MCVNMGKCFIFYNMVLPFASNHDMQTLKRLCLCLEHVHFVSVACYL